MKSKTITAALAALATAAVIGAGTATPASAFLACQVTDTGGVDDKSFNQTAWKGVQDAGKELGIEIKLLESKAETDRANAEAEAAGLLARAEQDKLVAVQERDALSEQALVTQERLDIEIRKPAEAEAYAEVQRANAQRDAANAATEADAYKRTKIAEANKVAAVQDAEAAATSVRFAGEAERDRQVALAAGVRAEGEARAAAIQAEGVAEAAATDAKAEALKKYGEAALAQEIISRLPEIVRAAAEPISNIDTLTVVSTDGASAVTKTVGQVLGEGTEVVKSLTGLDVGAILAGLAGGQLVKAEVGTD